MTFLCRRYPLSLILNKKSTVYRSGFGESVFLWGKGLCFMGHPTHPGPLPIHPLYSSSSKSNIFSYFIWKLQLFWISEHNRVTWPSQGNPSNAIPLKIDLEMNVFWRDIVTGIGNQEGFFLQTFWKCNISASYWMILGHVGESPSEGIVKQ